MFRDLLCHFYTDGQSGSCSRKVYGILVVQLLITLSFIAWFTYHEGTKRYVHNHMGIWWAAFAVMIVCLLTMACCGDVRRKAPMNFIFLFIFTLAESFMLGVAASTYETDAVCNSYVYHHLAGNEMTGK
jgi:FtsH-binding integral membrane protein